VLLNRQVPFRYHFKGALRVGSATIDHMISLIVFIAAILIFIGVFSQPIQTAIVYESHRALSIKTSDLLDTILLNPGINATWGIDGTIPTGFGLQDPEFTQYQLSSFSTMRLCSSTGNLIEYDKTSPNIYYKNDTLGFGSSLITPVAEELNYSTTLSLLGINNTYGFQFALTPDITVSVKENQAASPLTLSITATGIGFPFANAPINYCLLQVTMPQNETNYPSYTIQSAVVQTDQQGKAVLTFPSITDPNQVYAFIAYAHLDGVVGVGFRTRVSSFTDQSVVPLVEDIASQKIALAHSYDLNNSASNGFSLKYNTTFVIMKQDYTLSELSLDSLNGVGSVGIVNSGVGNPYPTISLPACTTGIVIVTYQQDGSTQGGIVMMPWGISSLALPVTFGGNPAGQNWVTTDIRQVTVSGITYQAKLSLWNSNENSVAG